MNKTVLILANSIRLRHRCIAGREAVKDGDRWRIGAWIRPVSPDGEGEVSRGESVCADGSQPGVLDVVSIPLLRNQDCHGQPENHLIEPGVLWQKVSRMRADPAMLAETPTGLWLEGYGKTDRIKATVVTAWPDVRSLYIIRPANLRFRYWQETSTFHGNPHKQRRAVFAYNRVTYALPITDPTMDARYFEPFPALDEPPREKRPQHPERCLLVVSLGAPFKDGCHYKLVATVLEY